METTSIDEAKAVLYGYPAESFVAERDLLVKAIRSGGERELAAQVKALRKPSAVAALVNEIVRADPAGVDLILQAAALLRSAQAGALAGTGINAAELQQQYRAAIGALAQAATARPAEVRAALEAATIDEASNNDLRMGCLVVVPTPTSIFGSAPVETVAPPEPVTSSKAQPVDELEQRRALRLAKKTAKDQHTKAQAANAAAEKAAAAAEKAAAAAAKAERAEAERRRKAAKKALDKKRKALQKEHREALRTHLAALDDEAAASTAADAAEQELDRTDAEITAAEQALTELRERRDDIVASCDEHDRARAAAADRAEQANHAVQALEDALQALEAQDERLAEAP